MNGRAILFPFLLIVLLITLAVEAGCRKDTAGPDEAECGLTHLSRSTFAGEERGSFDYEYCHRENLNAEGGHYPGGFTNTGAIHFRPDSEEPYKASFKSDFAYPLLIGGLRIGDTGEFEVYFNYQ